MLGRSYTCPNCAEELFISHSSDGTKETIRLKTGSKLENGEIGHQGNNPGLSQIANYRLVKLLGEGAFGKVWLAEEPLTHRKVAIKLPRMTQGDGLRAARFVTEGRAAAKLRHPNIVAVLHAGKIKDNPFIATEYVEGATLSEICKRGNFEAKEAAAMISKLAFALHYAHSQGIIHRDIKPQNIIVDRENEPQIVDFGLAKQLDHETSLTLEGSVLGTPAYMPPEQAKGEQNTIGPASDQYSLACCLYRMITGVAPFEGNAAAVLHQVVHSRPKEASQIAPSIAPVLSAICHKAMSYSPNARYRSCEQFGDDLRRFIDGTTTQASPFPLVYRAVEFCQRNRLEAVLVALFVAVFVFSALASGLGWKNAIAAKKEVARRDQAALMLVKEQQAIQEEMQTTLLSISKASQRIQEANTRMEQETAALNAEKSAINEAKTRIDEITADIRLSNRKLAKEEERLTLLQRNIQDSEQERIERNHESAELLGGDRFLSDSIQRVVAEIESSSFEAAQRELDRIPVSFRCWETQALQSLVKKRRTTFPMQSVDLSESVPKHLFSGIWRKRWRWELIEPQKRWSLMLQSESRILHSLQFDFRDGVFRKDAFLSQNRLRFQDRGQTHVGSGGRRFFDNASPSISVSDAAGMPLNQMRHFEVLSGIRPDGSEKVIWSSSESRKLESILRRYFQDRGSDWKTVRDQGDARTDLTFCVSANAVYFLAVVHRQRFLFEDPVQLLEKGEDKFAQETLTAVIPISPDDTVLEPRVYLIDCTSDSISLEERGRREGRTTSIGDYFYVPTILNDERKFLAASDARTCLTNARHLSANFTSLSDPSPGNLSLTRWLRLGIDGDNRVFVEAHGDSGKTLLLPLEEPFKYPNEVFQDGQFLIGVDGNHIHFTDFHAIVTEP